MSKVTDGSYGSLGTPDGADYVVAVESTGPAVKTLLLSDLRKYTSQNYIPGGRLTLESGVPVSTTNQTAKTTVYYTPCVHNVINLWDGANWVPTEFTEASLALGTITSALPYDVFGYLSGGVLTLELLAWTSDSARATAVTLQDGRYCKSGDKTRLLLGTFYTTSTTTTEDSASARYLWNSYNRIERQLLWSDSTSGTYTTATDREWRGGSTNGTSRASFVLGVAGQAATATAHFYMTRASGVAGYVGVGFNSANIVGGALTGAANVIEARLTFACVGSGVLGKNYFCSSQYGISGVTYQTTYGTGVVSC